MVELVVRLSGIPPHTYARRGWWAGAHLDHARRPRVAPGPEHGPNNGLVDRGPPPEDDRSRGDLELCPREPSL